MSEFCYRTILNALSSIKPHSHLSVPRMCAVHVLHGQLTSSFILMCVFTHQSFSTVRGSVFSARINALLCPSIHHAHYSLCIRENHECDTDPTGFQGSLGRDALKIIFPLCCVSETRMTHGQQNMHTRTTHGSFTDIFMEASLTSFSQI